MALSRKVPPQVSQRPFGTGPEGATVRCFALQGAGGARVEVLEHGAVLRGVWLPDGDGGAVDVVLGYDDPAGYAADPFYLGAVVGRFANRIRGAEFVLDGERVRLAANDPPHHLHGGERGFSRRRWSGRPFRAGDTVGVRLERTSPDGEEGYPGTLEVAVEYALDPANTLSVEFRATTDRATPVSLVQHTYFNLAGGGDVLDHELRVAADAFTPLGSDAIPEGTLAPVQGTPLDFRAARRIGDRIDEADAQMRIAGGYDHNLVLRGGPGTLRPVAWLRDPASGRALELATTLPGMQLYSANFLDGRPGKGGRPLVRRGALCLEAQQFPDAPNQPAFPDAVLRPGAALRARTEFRFHAER